MSTAGDALTGWLRSMPSLQDVEWQLKKAEAVRAWCVRGIGFGVGDRVEIVREQNTANGWAPYRECLAVGATGVVKGIDFNPYWYDGEGGWYADVQLDREWSTSSDGHFGPWWHGKAEDTPEGMQPPSEYDQEKHPEGRHHVFSIAVGDLAPPLTGGSTETADRQPHSTAQAGER